MTKDTLPSPVSVPEGDAREIANFDELDDKADEWMAECGVKEMVANIAVVFASWASPELLARFREQVEAIMHLSFVEGAIRSRDTLPSPVSVPEGDAREIAQKLYLSLDDMSGLEGVRAITAALLSAESRARPQWQPIETAPKDCTMFLAFYEACHVVACWEPYAGENGDWVEAEGGKTFQPFHLTHWQPLPAPPSLSSPEDG